jgi:UDP:flavonoid glycosyltransferase YjiC (YdhE family)
LRTNNAEVFEFLEKANEDGVPVVYISIGTVCQWMPWKVEAFYRGLKQMKVRVLWSLNKPELLSEQDPNFLVRPWMPQQNLLAHSAVRVAVCHCGFSGINECLGQGVPIACFPHFGDQFFLASQAVDSGYGLGLFRFSKLTITQDKIMEQPRFNAEDVKRVVGELLTNGKYRANA